MSFLKMTSSFIIVLIFLVSCSVAFSVPACGPNECDQFHPCAEHQRCVYNFCRYECFTLPEQDPACPKKNGVQGYCPDQCSHANHGGCKIGYICCFTGCGNECCVPEIDSEMSKHNATRRSHGR